MHYIIYHVVYQVSNTIAVGLLHYLLIVNLLQGNAGIGLSVLIIFLTLCVALVAVLSAIGAVERCHMQSGGVYFLLSHILGSRLGATVGILYCFGQVSKYIFTLFWYRN